jgi:hypothetical protein
MKPRWLHLLLFVLLLLALTTVLRLTLHTVPGLIALAGICAARLLKFLYQSMEMLVIALWDVSASIAERVQESRERRASGKEERHAARLL